MRVQVRQELSERYRATRTTGAAHDMKGSGVMHPLSSEVVKACIPAGQIKVRLRLRPRATLRPISCARA